MQDDLLCACVAACIQCSIHTALASGRHVCVMLPQQYKDSHQEAIVNIRLKRHRSKLHGAADLQDEARALDKGMIM